MTTLKPSFPFALRPGRLAPVQSRALRTALLRCRASSPVPAAVRAPLALGTAFATLATAAGALAQAALPAAADAAAPLVDNGWLSPIVDSLDFVLTHIEAVYLDLGLPYPYGWSIVTLTAFVKVLTLPLTKKQVESAMAVQSLKPRIDIIKERYGEDKDKISKETSRLYEQAKVNPLAGCLPSLASIPIFIGLYRSLSNVANSGALDAEGFYWVPSLAGPMSLAARQGDGGISWLYPFVDGAPPIGWEAAGAYLVLPVLLVVAQYASTAIISPVDPNQEQSATQTVLIGALPLMIGWFSLNVPAGLSLYYFSNSVFTSAQQIYFRKLGGVVLDTPDLGPVKQLGMGRRTGEPVAPVSAKAAWAAARASRGDAPVQTQAGPGPSGNGVATNGAGSLQQSAPALRVKRKKLNAQAVQHEAQAQAEPQV